MMVYLLATIMMASNNYNTGFTRHGYLQVRAQFLAQAASQQALARLNTVAGWEKAHEGQANADKSTVEESNLEAWTEPIDKDRVRLIGLGTISGRSQRISQVLLKKPAVTAIDYVLEDTPGASPDLVFAKADNEPDWKTLPVAEARHWDDQGLNQVEDRDKDGNLKSATNLKCLCGDGQGNVYAIWTRSGHDEILRYNSRVPDGKWQLLPPLLNQDRNGKSLGARQLVPDLEGIAVNADRDLVVLDKRSGQDGIFHLDLKTLDADVANGQEGKTPWVQVPPPPKGTFKAPPKGSPSNQKVFVPAAKAATQGEVNQVCVDNNGDLFMLSRTGSPPPIYRFQPGEIPRPDGSVGSDWSNGNWNVLPPPPRTYFTVATKAQLNGGKLKANETLQEELVEHELDDQLAFNLDYLAVDPSTSQLFSRYHRPTAVRKISASRRLVVPQIDTIFRLSLAPPPEKGSLPLQLDGKWTADPLPPPNIHYDRNGLEEEGGGRADLAYNTVDHASNLMGLWPTSGNPHTIFRCDLTSKTWKTMPPVPKQVFDKKTGQPILNLSDGFSAQITGLGGGGVPNPSGLSRYIPTVTY